MTLERCDDGLVGHGAQPVGGGLRGTALSGPRRTKAAPHARGRRANTPFELTHAQLLLGERNRYPNNVYYWPVLVSSLGPEATGGDLPEGESEQRW